jgi:uncharacterized protein
MYGKKMSDKTLEKIIEKILEVIIPDKIILFGSRAKGNARGDSDYDLLIIQKSDERNRKIAQKLYLHLDLPVSVDLIVQTPETVEINKKMFYSIVKEAVNEGKVVYEHRG